MRTTTDIAIGRAIGQAVRDTHITVIESMKADMAAMGAGKESRS